MASFYVKSGSGVTAFAQSTAYNVGDRIVKLLTDAGTNATAASRWVWECTTGGTTAAANPTWPSSITQDVTTVTSGTAVFTARRPGYSSGTTANWTYATPYLKYGAAAAINSGDIVYVSNNHNESQSAAYSIAAGSTDVSYLCVQDSAAPPTSLATTGTVSTTGTAQLTFGAGSNWVYVYGLVLVAGSGATNASFTVPNGSCEQCTFQVGTTSASATIGLNEFNIWKNCNCVFADAGQMLTSGSAYTIEWRGGSVSGSAITQLFNAGAPYQLVVSGIDFSSCASTLNFFASGSGRFPGEQSIHNCKLPASWSGSINSQSPARYSVSTLHSSDNTSTNYRFQRKTTTGTVVSETTIIKSGGANNGTAGISWKMVSTSGTLSKATVHSSGEIVAWNDVIGTTRTVTIDILRDSATGLTDQEMWIEVSYLSSTGSPLGALVSSAPSILATPTTLAASSATWTTTGMSNPNAQKISVSFTPQMKGFVHVKVYLAKASTTVYVDPAITLS